MPTSVIAVDSYFLLMKSKAAWDPTVVIATEGHFVKENELLRQMKQENAKKLPKKTWASSQVAPRVTKWVELLVIKIPCTNL